MTTTYTTGTGQTIVGIHEENLDCRTKGCVIHNPSPHHMRNWLTNWREDTKLMERICPHGVGHPDPDSLDLVRREFNEDVARTSSIHGCDGCCCPPQDLSSLT